MEDKYEEFDLFSFPIPASQDKKLETATGNEPENKPIDAIESPSPSSHYDPTLSPVPAFSQINQPDTTTGRPLQVYTKRLQITAQPCASASS